MRGKAMELLSHFGHQRVERVLIAFTPGDQQLRDIGGGSFAHLILKARIRGQSAQREISWFLHWTEIVVEPSNDFAHQLGARFRIAVTAFKEEQLLVSLRCSQGIE